MRGDYNGHRRVTLVLLWVMAFICGALSVHAFRQGDLWSGTLMAAMAAALVSIRPL